MHKCILNYVNLIFQFSKFLIKNILLIEELIQIIIMSQNANRSSILFRNIWENPWGQSIQF